MKNMMICLMNFRPQKVKQIEKNEIGSYLEEAEAFYIRKRSRRRCLALGIMNRCGITRRYSFC